MRDKEHHAVRDNVLFELGVFIGHLGIDRSFIVTPRGTENFHLPSDLLGLTSLNYDPNRQDNNLQAALGPACNQLRTVFDKARTTLQSAEPRRQADQDLGKADILAILQSWMGSRDAQLNTQVIKYSEVDQDLTLPSGSTKQYIEKVASTRSYIVEHKGEHNILFKETFQSSFTAIPRTNNRIRYY